MSDVESENTPAPEEEEEDLSADALLAAVRNRNIKVASPKRPQEEDDEDDEDYDDDEEEEEGDDDDEEEEEEEEEQEKEKEDEDNEDLNSSMTFPGKEEMSLSKTAPTSTGANSSAASTASPATAATMNTNTAPTVSTADESDEDEEDDHAMELQLLQDMIADRDARIVQIQESLKDHNGKMTALRQQLQAVQASNQEARFKARRQMVTFTRRMNDADSRFTSLERDIQQQNGMDTRHYEKLMREVQEGQKQEQQRRTTTKEQQEQMQRRLQDHLELKDDSVHSTRSTLSLPIGGGLPGSGGSGLVGGGLLSRHSHHGHNLRNKSYVVRVQSQLCKAMHSMGILEHQLELTNGHSAEMIKFLKDSLNHIMEEKSTMELQLMNELMQIDSAQKQKRDELDLLMKHKEEELNQFQASLQSLQESMSNMNVTTKDEPDEEEEEDDDDSDDEIDEDLLEEILDERKEDVQELETLKQRQATQIAKLQAELARIRARKALAAE